MQMRWASTTKSSSAQDSACGATGSTSLLGTPTQVGSSINLNEAHQLGLSWDGTTLHLLVDNPLVPVASFTTGDRPPGHGECRTQCEDALPGLDDPKARGRWRGPRLWRLRRRVVDGVLVRRFQRYHLPARLVRGLDSSGPMLNPAKWGKGTGSDALELVRESEGGALRARDGLFRRRRPGVPEPTLPREPGGHDGPAGHRYPEWLPVHQRPGQYPDPSDHGRERRHRQWGNQWAISPG